MKNKIEAVLFDFDDTLYPFDNCECKTIEVIFLQMCKRLEEEAFGGFDRFWQLYCDTRRKVDGKLCMGFLDTGRNSTKEIKVEGARLIQAGSHNRTVIFKQLLTDFFSEKGIPLQQLLTDFFSGKRIPLQIVRLSHDLGKLYETIFIQHMTDSYDPKVTCLLDELRNKGKYKLGLITNYTLSSQLRKLRKLGIEGQFETIVTSEETGADKPDSRIFMRALDELGGVKPKNAVMIGDSDTDIAGAKNLGIWTIRFKQSEKIRACREKRKAPKLLAAKKTVKCNKEKATAKNENVKKWENLIQADATVCNLKELKKLLSICRDLPPKKAFLKFKDEYY